MDSERTCGKQPASSTAKLIDPWTGIFSIGTKSLQVEVEDLLIMQDGLSGGKSRDRVYLGQDQSRKSERGILIVSVRPTLSDKELSLHLRAH
jgi:hypothetical protein